ALFPRSVRALIAARLDTLEQGAKSMLADAAVLGTVFWTGALVQMGERTLEDVDQALAELTDREFVRPAPRSTIEGETEYGFGHVLTRDVAYAELTRSSRASRHVAAARWLESAMPERLESHASVLAHHYVT